MTTAVGTLAPFPIPLAVDGLLSGRSWEGEEDKRDDG